MVHYSLELIQFQIFSSFEIRYIYLELISASDFVIIIGTDDIQVFVTRRFLVVSSKDSVLLNFLVYIVYKGGEKGGCIFA